MWSSALPAAEQAPRPTASAAASAQASSQATHKDEPRAASKKKQKLSSRIDEILADPEVARGFLGIQVLSVRSGRSIYSLNADRLFAPASNTKMFTTAAALALIGPQYRFRTTVESPVAIDKNGRLAGDIVLVARGDPNLSGRVFPYNIRTERRTPHTRALEELADQVVARGVRFIDGDVVADDTFYIHQPYGDDWAADDLMWEYGAPISAFCINDNTIFVSIRPGDRPGAPALLAIDPFPDYFQVENRVLTLAAGKKGTIEMDREPGSTRLRIWGSIAQDSTGEDQQLAIQDAADFAARIFRQSLEKRGITIYGKVRVRHREMSELPVTDTALVAPTPASPPTTAAPPATTAPAAAPPSAPAMYGERPAPAVATPPAAGVAAEKVSQSIVPGTVTVLAEMLSLPLSEDVRVINKDSQNLHAELALRLLAHEKGTAATAEAGLAVLKRFFDQAGIQPEEYALYDGSGLSRRDLVTPNAVVKLLRYAATQPWGGQWAESLPVGGTDGTLRNRMKDPLVRGRISAKTGTLSHVATLSGYANTVKGERVAFAILFNNSHLTQRRTAANVVDEIADAIVDDETYRTH